ncbi:MAG: TetR/AcrR family transcriptional regulator [Acidobacteriota bacterium]
MARPKQYDRSDVALRAMQRFWQHGYYASSIRDLVAATGVNRHGLYGEFGDKRGLFVAAVEAYCEAVVTPAFAAVEAPGAGWKEIRAYFEHQIALAESVGLPGPGCLLANTMVESGPHEALFQALVEAHLERLERGFRQALAGVAASPADAERWAAFLVVSTQGLWSYSRTTARAEPLRAYVEQLLLAVERGVGA